MVANELFLLSYLSKQEIQDILDNKANQIQQYAYILHDKDTFSSDKIDSDTGLIIAHKGDLKKEHCHIYLKLYNSRDINEICRWFSKNLNGEKVNCLREKVRSRIGVLNYLTHKNAAEKYQYPDSDIVSYGLSAEDNDLSVDDTYIILTDFISGKSLKELVRLYGAKFLYHYNSYKLIKSDIELEDSLALQNLGFSEVVPSSDEINNFNEVKND